MLEYDVSGIFCHEESSVLRMKWTNHGRSLIEQNLPAATAMTFPPTGSSTSPGASGLSEEVSASWRPSLP